MTTPAAPAVLFVCVKNGGKSQMAAGLMRSIAGDRVTVDSGGTAPGPAINALSVQSLLEVGVDITDQVPKAITQKTIDNADLVITLGREVQLDPIPGTQFENWDTDEPSERGIDGIERMRLVRDDINRRVTVLARQLES